MRMRVLFGVLVVGLIVAGWWSRPEAVPAQEKKETPSAFSSQTVDVGVCVTNIERSAAFYKAIGFTEIDGFSVPADFASEAGLTAKKQLDVRVFVLGKEKTATKIKLMQIAGTSPKKSDNANIHAQTGYRYLTLFVTDMNAAMDRLKKANATILGKAPHLLPKGFPAGVYLTVFKDPDGNLIEFVGPKK